MESTGNHNYDLIFLNGYRKEDDRFKLIDMNPRSPRKKWYTRNKLLFFKYPGLLEVDEFINPQFHCNLNKIDVTKLEGDKMDMLSSPLKKPNPVFQRAKRIKINKPSEQFNEPIILISKFNQHQELSFLPDYLLTKKTMIDRISLKNLKLLPFGEMGLIENYLEEKQLCHAIELLLDFTKDHVFYPKKELLFDIVSQCFEQLFKLKEDVELQVEDMIKLEKKKGRKKKSDELTSSELNSKEEKEKPKGKEKEFNRKVENNSHLLIKLCELLEQLREFVDPSHLLSIFIEDEEFKLRRRLLSKQQVSQSGFWKWMEILSYINKHEKFQEHEILLSSCASLFKQFTLIFEFELRLSDVGEWSLKSLPKLLDKDHSWPYRKIENILALLFDSYELENSLYYWGGPSFYFHYLLTLLSHTNIICFNTLVHHTSTYYHKIDDDALRHRFLSNIISLPFQIQLINYIMIESFSLFGSKQLINFIQTDTFEETYLKCDYKQLMLHQIHKNNSHGKLDQNGLPLSLKKESIIKMYHGLKQFISLKYLLISAFSIIIYQSGPESIGSQKAVQKAKYWKSLVDEHVEEVKLLDEYFKSHIPECNDILDYFDKLILNHSYF